MTTRFQRRWRVVAKKAYRAGFLCALAPKLKGATEKERSTVERLARLGAEFYVADIEAERRWG